MNEFPDNMITLKTKEAAFKKCTINENDHKKTLKTKICILNSILFGIPMQLSRSAMIIVIMDMIAVIADCHHSDIGSFRPYVSPICSLPRSISLHTGCVYYPPSGHGHATCLCLRN